MPSPELLEFTDAIEDVQSRELPSIVLLGNGFSMDYSAETFGYDSLAEEAKLPNLSVKKKKLFERLGSTNFETVVERLRAAADLTELYGGEASLAETFRNDAKVVQNGLADVLADRHPEHAYILTDDEVQSARAFLSNFDELFTLSYDLLLYWVVNRTMAGYAPPQADGFEWPTFHDRGFLVWKVAPSTPQDVHYLHGALHLYVQDHRVRKLSYNQDGRLVEELRTRIESGRYPLVVTEGTCDEKIARIDRSAYLRTAHRRFANIEGALFVHGVSMSPNDDHVFEALESEDSQVETLYIGVHGRITSRSGQNLRARAELIQDRRREAKGQPLEINYYDTKSARVWR